MPFDPWSVLTPKQAAVAREFIAARERERTHLVVYLSGAHAYGFPSPDSDLDLKCVHIAPTQQLVGLNPPDEPPDRIDMVDGVELDYGSNELSPVLRGVLKGNGNFIERMLGELVLFPGGGSESRPLHLGGDPALLIQARAVVSPLLSRRVGRHYGGFAASQLRAFDEKPTVKRALYVLRTAATGRHVLAHGEIVTDVTKLRAFVPAELDELLVLKRRGEQQELSRDDALQWRARLVASIDAIDTAWPTSILPAEPDPAAVDALDLWLREVRRAHW